MVSQRVPKSEWQFFRAVAPIDRPVHPDSILKHRRFFDDNGERLSIIHRRYEVAQYRYALRCGSVGHVLSLSSGTTRDVTIRTPKAMSESYGAGMYMVHPAGEPLLAEWTQRLPLDVIQIRIPTGVLQDVIGDAADYRKQQCADRLFPARRTVCALAELALDSLDSELGQTAMMQACMTRCTALFFADAYRVDAKEYSSGRQLSCDEFVMVLAQLAASAQSNSKCPTVADLADALSLSESYFSRTFRNTIGMPPLSLYRRLRVERAGYLLRRGELGLHEVAFECGFADQAHMTRQFKQAFEMTPGQYLATNGKRSAT